jgi:Glycosyl hydrolase family 115/Gylcosyl hydrolase family 115 C-terminal domain
MKNPPFLAGTFALLLALVQPACADLEILSAPANDADCVTIAGGKNIVTIAVDEKDFSCVKLAANFFADDVQRVTGQRPKVDEFASASQMVIAGTLGHSALIDKLVADGKLSGVEKIRGQWETTLMQVVEKPFAGVDRALVIAGSDRRGTAYGLMQLSEEIGVSPWNWWADVPARHRDFLGVKISAPQTDAPGVKYRGIFINDEDWGLNAWASKTFDPKFGNIGPKTYEKVFELLLRLRLNYIWPAMHPCSAEFGSVPENYELADKFGIVAGSSHCEPMLCNNVHWGRKKLGPWNYLTNRDAIHDYWEENAKARGADEAVWTLGIRGIHDAGMETPPKDTAGKINLLSQVFYDQRTLLDKYATTNFGPVAQCFVPYKEVLPVYDAGLKVPDDVTLVWTDDNFGYIRRFSSPTERQRAGGAGIYWHTEYYGSPHSYTWIDTTAPALMWEELHKAWENNARSLWVINVGDIKPAEPSMDYFSRLAWNPDGFANGAQKKFLADFVTENFGIAAAPAMTDLLMEFYRLGTVHKPELMCREWALSLSTDRAAQLENDYNNLLRQEKLLAETIPADAHDAYDELVGFPVRVLGNTGLIFMADRKIQNGNDAAANEKLIQQLRAELEAQVKNYNTQLAGGKWNYMMPGLVTGKFIPKWSSQVRWPWGEPTNQPLVTAAEKITGNWRDAAADRRTASGNANWSTIEGLGSSGQAVALLPATLENSWKETDATAPALEFDFTNNGGDENAFVEFLPTFRLVPGMKLRVAVAVDNQPATVAEVPGSSGKEDERGTARMLAVQDNFVRLRVPLPKLAAGKHTFKIRAIDPGAVIDRVNLP